MKVYTNFNRYIKSVIENATEEEYRYEEVGVSDEFWKSKIHLDLNNVEYVGNCVKPFEVFRGGKKDSTMIMQQYLNVCEQFYIEDVLPYLDKNIIGEYNNINELVCGVYQPSRLIFVYNVNIDIHYFYDY